MNYNEVVSYCKAMIILDRLQVELKEDSPYETPSPKETRERILEAMYKLEELNEERVQPEPDEPDAETIKMWKDGLWEDYNAGRISSDALEEELKDIEELEKSLQP